MRRLVVPLFALLVAVLAIWALEARRAGLDIADLRVGATPVTRYQEPGTDGPPVVVAHGFAGSRQMMQAYSLTLARAGYRVYAFDFEGHGRNPVPMSGDVTSIDGTTRLLIDQTRSVIDFAAQDTGWTGPVALLGHSMATDVIIRTAVETPDTEPVVAISAFSEAVTQDSPNLLLIIAGAWEPNLRNFALEAVRKVLPGAELGTTVTGFVTRRAVVAPYVEHVAILHSRFAQREALNWLNRAYRWNHTAAVPPTGWYFLTLMAALVVLGVKAMSLVPQVAARPGTVPGRPFWIAAVAVPVIVPFLATQLDIRMLPVLVADYLAVHLLLLGAGQLLLLRLSGVPMGKPSIPGVIALAVWCLAVFGLALDRYGASFVPIPERLWIVVALLVGAVPFMLADRRLGHDASVGRRAVLRLGFFGSLLLAILLDPGRLFFLAMIAPVIVLFYAVFGTLGRALDRRTGPLAPGIALGLVLAWSLGVSFPMFVTLGAGG